MTGFDCALRVVGPVGGQRRLVRAAASFAAAASCDHDPARESYLSAFTFGDAMPAHVAATGSTAAFPGPVYSPWLWFDIDRPDVEAARVDAVKLVARTLERYPTLDEDSTLAFFSGSKGFHVGLPTGLFGVDNIKTFNVTARAVADRLAGAAGVTIDTSIYDKTRLLRAPNSRHPKTGLHKRRLTVRELAGLTAGRIQALAAHPSPFDVPAADVPADPVAAADWAAAPTAPTTRAGESGRAALQRATLDLLRGRDVPDAGDRNTRLYRAAANLAEHGTPAAVVHQLLAGLCDLPPVEAAKAIRSGILKGSR